MNFVAGTAAANRDVQTSDPETSIIDAFEGLYDPGTGGWHMPEWMDLPFRADQVAEWRATKPVWYSPVEREVGHFYRSLTAMLRPRAVLETGTNAGYSAACIARGLLDAGGTGRLVTVDLRETPHIFRGSEVEHLIAFVNAHSLYVSPDSLLRAAGDAKQFDMLVLDSDHRYGSLVGEINRFGPLLSVGGIMVLHDTMVYDGLGLVVRELTASGAFEVVNLPTPRTHGNPNGRRPGITIARKRMVVPFGFLPPNPALLETEVNLPGRTSDDPPLI